MQDFFDIDSALSEEERAVRASVRQFVDERILPIIGNCYVEGRFPKEIIPGLAELGVFGANLPEEYGCAGLNNVAYGLIMQELERGDSGVRSFASVQGALAMYPIYAFGSEEQKRKWLPKMATGEVIGAFQLQQQRLATMLTEIVKAQLVALHLGRLKDAGKFTPQQVSLAKRNNCDIATNVAREARRLLGANGILAEYGAMRHMANLESVYTYEGTHDIHTLILGQAVTGLSAFN
jgi:alkylation response protein AidB-like acyl-CoA dehydrogenase